MMVGTTANTTRVSFHELTIMMIKLNSSCIMPRKNMDTELVATSWSDVVSVLKRLKSSPVLRLSKSLKYFF